MNSRLSRMFDCIGGTGWWIIILFFIFLAFQDCWAEICISDWIPFLILLLIVCSCGMDNDDGYMEDDNSLSCGC